MCKHQYYYQGCRSYGDNIPGYAQGAYFPGDEPGERCGITDGPCQDADGHCPEDCNFQEETERLCPYCEEGPLHKSGRDVIYCPICGYRE